MKAEDYSDRAREALKAGLYDEAIAGYTRAIALVPGEPRYYRYRGGAFCDIGVFDLAIDDFYTAIGLWEKEKKTPVTNDRRTARAKYTQALADARSGRLKKALAGFDEAVALEPDYADAVFDRGFTWFNLGEYDKAIADYTRALELNPADAAALDYRGNARAAKGDYAGAFGDFSRALELLPGYSVVYYDMGQAYARTGNSAAAVNCFRRYLALQPSPDGHMIAWAWYSIACVLALEGRSDEALDSLEKALEEGLRDGAHLAQDADLDTLRSSPRFKKLMRKYFP